MKAKISLVLAGILLSLNALNVNAALTSESANGVSLVYDSGINATWTADANLLGTMEVANPNVVTNIIGDIGTIGTHTLSSYDFGIGGVVDWYAAKAFTAYLNILDYAGSNQWSLPVSNAVSGFNQTAAQQGELFYTELGGTAGNTIPSSSLFSNVQADEYWSGTAVTGNNLRAWGFNDSSGYQGNGNDNNQFYAWAVSPGDIAGFISNNNSSNAASEPNVMLEIFTGMIIIAGLGWHHTLRNRNHTKM